MPATSFGTSDPNTLKKWSAKTIDYALRNTVLFPLMGTSKNDAIYALQELNRDKGDTITVRSRSPMSGAGQGDGGNTTGNEEALLRRNMSIAIHERAHSFVSDGPISEKRTAVNIRQDGSEDLGEWFGEALENDLICATAGLYNENSSSAAIETINESYPTAGRIYYGGQSAAGALGNAGVTYASDALLTAGTQADNLMGTLHLSQIRRRFIACVPRPRPVNIRDESMLSKDEIRTGVQGPLSGRFYLVLLHPYQIKGIKAETGTTGWAVMTQNAQVRGNQNPIFSGAAFLWDGLVVWEYDRIPLRTGAAGTTLAEGFLLNAGRTATTDACANGRSVARGLMLGAQAVSFAWGQELKWHEDVVDARKPKVVVDAIYGVKRTVFNAHGGSTPGLDEAIYCLDSEVIIDS